MVEKEGQPRTQSPELAAGDGFTFEDAVAAYFLAALLGERYAPGVENSVVCGVTLQQRNFGEPLDDVIVDFRDTSGAPARLSLQVKRSLVISAAATNEDFRAVVRDSWATRQKTDFRKNVDRYGAAVGDIAKDKERNVVFLTELARNSVTTAHFEARFADGGNASAELKELKSVVSQLLDEMKGTACIPEEVHDFLAHFVLLRFDYPHVGACDPPETISSLRECLALDEAAMAPLLWTSLRQTARNSATKAGQFDRTRLVRELSQTFHLRAAPSLRSDLEKLTSLTRICVADIQNDVGGQRLDRKALVLKLEEATTNAKFVQITGLPGSGKSVLLRQSIDAALELGPVILLKPDRLEGKSWMSFAAANGLSGAPLPALLAEVAATGSSTLYIDGIDRVDKENRPIVIDVIRTILTTPFLDNWKIVVSMRDTGIEPLRNWLGKELNTLSVSTVKVGPLDDVEAEALAKAKPALRALLFGQTQVRDIVRRPFFARIIFDQQLTSDGTAPAFQPQSEVDLIDHWWQRGGYNADGQDALDRQRAIVDIGARRARHLSRAVSLSEVSPASAGLIIQLVSDGILQHAERGHTVKFSHDPPWVKAGRRDRESSRIFEWTHKMGSTLGRVLGRLPLADTKPLFLDPVFALEGDTCWAMLAPLLSAYICRYIFDAKEMPGDAIDLVQLCLERFLTAPVFKRSEYRSGEFSGMHEPDLARTLMFISVEKALGAARYVNGDWSGINTILPIINRFVRSAGWSPSVMGNFLTLCERAKAEYPAETFADQILSIVADVPERFKGWRGTTLPARIAGLVQHLANRETPMPQILGEKLLRILDIQVDMGDRRSAALQQSENFREIKIG